MYAILDSIGPRKFAIYTGINLCMELLHLPLGVGPGATEDMILRMLPPLADAFQEADPPIANTLRDCVAKLQRFQLHPQSWLLHSEYELGVLRALELLTDALQLEMDRAGALETTAPKPQRSRSR